jgi:hypothetical protein
MSKSVRNQSDSSKAIKRINERIAELTRLKAQDNPYIAAYSRAIRETGVEYTQDKGTGRYRIRNTTENRRKAEQLEKRLTQLKAETVGGLKEKAKAELKKEAETLAQGKTEKEKRKIIKQYTSRAKVQERIQEKLQDIEIQEKLDVIYQVMGERGKALGEELSQLTAGKSKGEQDTAQIYDVFGRISQAYRAIQRGEIEQADMQRQADLENLYRNFEYGDDKEE